MVSSLLGMLNLSTWFGQISSQLWQKTIHIGNARYLNDTYSTIKEFCLKPNWYAMVNDVLFRIYTCTFLQDFSIQTFGFGHMYCAVWSQINVRSSSWVFFICCERNRHPLQEPTRKFELAQQEGWKFERSLLQNLVPKPHTGPYMSMN